MDLSQVREELWKSTYTPSLCRSGNPNVGDITTSMLRTRELNILYETA